MESWVDRFPELGRLSASDRSALATAGRPVAAPAGARVFGPGAAPDDFLLVLDGVVRVQQGSPSGREIVLFRVRPGESCVLTTACLLAHRPYAAEGVAETDVAAIALPRALFDRLLAGSEPFRRFVFDAYAQRLTDLLLVIEEVAFRRIDLRLAEALLDRAEPDGFVRLTHQQLATELGSAREVISRQLQEFQRRRLVASTRGAVQILDRDALTQLSKADAPIER